MFKKNIMDNNFDGSTTDILLTISNFANMSIIILTYSLAPHLNINISGLYCEAGLGA